MKHVMEEWKLDSFVAEGITALEQYLAKVAEFHRLYPEGK